MVRVFADDPGYLGSIPGHVIPKTSKWYLIPPCLTLSNIRYVSMVKWRNPGKGVASFPALWCSRYWKGSLLVALDYGRQLYFLLILYLKSVKMSRREKTSSIRITAFLAEVWFLSSRVPFWPRQSPLFLSMLRMFFHLRRHLEDCSFFLIYFILLFFSWFYFILLLSFLFTILSHIFNNALLWVCFQQTTVLWILVDQ